MSSGLFKILPTNYLFKNHILNMCVSWSSDKTGGRTTQTTCDR